MDFGGHPYALRHLTDYTDAARRLDRTREWWLAAHQEFFRRYLPTIGVDFDSDVATVFERFEMLSRYSSTRWLTTAGAQA
ncbi:MAG: hypothetical protein ACRDZS_12215 [Acidimicrobiales bacterium]